MDCFCNFKSYVEHVSNLCSITPRAGIYFEHQMLPFLCLNVGISLEVWEMEKSILTHGERRVKISKYVDQDLEKWEW